MSAWLSSVMSGLTAPELPADSHYFAAGAPSHPLRTDLQETVCGQFEDPSEHDENPTCPRCRLRLAEDDAERQAEIEERYPVRRLTRNERLELMADHGIDTNEERECER